MSVFVSEIYKLTNLQKARILTGKSGFQNQVSRISILDHEFYSDKIKEEFIKNDFVITSFLFAKDDPSKVCETIRILIQNGVSMLGIKNVYYQELPDSIMTFALEHDFSIFLFGHDTYYENIITEVADVLRLSERNELIETKVSHLLQNRSPGLSPREIALDINSSFGEQFGVLYCYPANPEEGDSLYRTLERLKRLEYFRGCHTIFKYRSGLMAILTFSGERAFSPRAVYHEFLSHVSLSTADYFVGVSEVFPSLHFLDTGIDQSLYACRLSRVEKKNVTFFRDIGLYQLVLPFLDSPWLDNYYFHIIDPILDYDRSHDAELLPTAIAYVENDGNIRKTSEALFQHENTVRYRIRKLRELLNMTEPSAKFYPQLCFAVQIYRLKNHD